MRLTEFTLAKGMSSFLIMILPGFGFCQSKGDSSQMAYARAKEIYFRTLNSELNLYNGVYYRGYNQNDSDEGQPYFGSDNWYGGSISYDGVLYENVSMMYDLLEDKVIIDHQYGGVKLELIKEKIKYFIINGHHFVHLTSALSNASIPPGFYEILFEGKNMSYARWQKKRIDVVTAHEVQVRYEDQNRFYILKGNKYFPVKTKSSILNVLKDKKPALQKFIRKQKLKFGTRCAESIPKVLSFYESGSYE